jgi:hypothetical protein
VPVSTPIFSEIDLQVSPSTAVYVWFEKQKRGLYWSNLTVVFKPNPWPNGTRPLLDAGLGTLVAQASIEHTVMCQHSVARPDVDMELRFWFSFQDSAVLSS